MIVVFKDFITYGLFVYFILYLSNYYQKKELIEDTIDDNDDNDNDTKNQVYEYNNHYTLKDISNNDIDDSNTNYKNSILFEFVPGLIILHYDKELGQFIYYSNANINHDILDKVVLKYVNIFDCHHIYTKFEATDNDNRKKTFKNKRTAKIFSKKMNVYKYMGKINNYQLLQKNGIISHKKINFKDFKNNLNTQN
jgi:hypothetical protein